MDKSWLDLRNRGNKRYIEGVDSFLKWAFSQPRAGTLIRCPCKGCMNTAYKLKIEVRRDLLKKGFWNSYKVWDLHGELLVRDENVDVASSEDVDDDSVEEDDMIGMIHDACGQINMEDENNFSENNEEPNMQAEKFYKLLEDAQTELYPGCKNVSKLSFVVRLLHLKCLNHWSNKSTDALLSLFKEVLPEGSYVPDSFYEAKKVLRDLGLEYNKIDACENDCILYWREYANAQSCPKCSKSRWKTQEHGGKKVANKVLRHFPIKPRLQRLYMARETAKKMRWHKEERIDDGVMRHPSDSIAWKSFDETHPTFSAELRNVRLGLASDGFQPYGNMSSNHSIWPVVLVPYNLPPWDCMKDSYFMMTLLIPGPKCPGSCSNKKRGRGKYKSKTVDIKTRCGSKITVNIPDDIDRAVGSGARDIVNYCGLIMRSTISFRDGDWQAIVLKHGETMWLKVKDKFEISCGVRQHVFQAFVISTMQRLFRAWKARLSNHYSRYSTDADRLSNRPEDVEPEDWKYLVEYFGSEDFKVISDRNKRNREKQITKHSCGTKSFAEVEESTRNAQTGEKEQPDKIWEIQHTYKNDQGELVWSDPKSQEVHVQLQELVAQQKSVEIDNPMTRDEILSSVLGERAGYVRGKGYGKKPPKKSCTQQTNLEASVSSAMEIMRQEMQAEMDQKLLEEREQMIVELKRNMEEEMKKKLDEEREHVNLEVDKRIQQEMDKKFQEQLAAFMTQIQQQGQSV